MSDIIYSGKSSTNFFLSVLLRGGCILFIVFLTFHYQENPPVIIVASALFFIFFLIYGNDEIVVYSDRIVQSNTSIFDIVFKRKTGTYWIKNLKGASLQDNSIPDAVTGELIKLLQRLYPRQLSYDNERQFYLDLKSGDYITIMTSLGQKKVDSIVKAINSLI